MATWSNWDEFRRRGGAPGAARTGNELRDEVDHKMTWPLSGAVGDHEAHCRTLRRR
jgi:hypothetical protein